jgi:hypothetical protein
MHRAGDLITITIDGPLKGRTVEITAVRMFATDSGYYAKGIDGLLDPKDVTLTQERTGGNPCGTDCDPRSHDLVHTCDHCRGVCLCRIKRPPTTPA